MMQGVVIHPLPINIHPQMHNPGIGGSSREMPAAHLEGSYPA
jgi:hypothetical protein